MIAAVYVSSTQCTITGEHDQEYPLGRRLQVSQGVDGTCRATVQSASYSAGTGLTTVTIKESRFTSNLVSIKKGPSSPESMGQGLHTTEDDGGYMPASAFTDDEVTSLREMPVLAAGDANKVLGGNSDGSDWEMKEFEGTENRVTIVDAAGKKTFSTPQDSHTGASPTFAGLTLTALTGIMLANGSSAVGIVAADGALQILRRNAEDDAYEFASVNLADLGDALFSSVAAGDIIVRNASSQWVNLAKGMTRGDALSIDGSGDVAWGVPSIIREPTAGEALSEYKVVFPDSADSGEWKKADASDEDKSRPRGIVIQSGGIENAATGEVMLLGFVTNGSWTWTPGATLYLTTDGDLSETPYDPASPIEIGFAFTATTIFFFPAGAGSGGGGTNAITITAGEILSQYDPVYKKTSDAKWYKGDPDGTAEETNIWAVVIKEGGIAQDGTGSAVLPPALLTNVSWAFTPGADLWLDTDGSVTDSEPSADWRKVLGFAPSATQWHFFPYPAWAEPTIPATGDILYYDGDEWTTLAIGDEDEVLTVKSGLPSWVAPTAPTP